MSKTTRPTLLRSLDEIRLSSERDEQLLIGPLLAQYLVLGGRVRADELEVLIRVPLDVLNLVLVLLGVERGGVGGDPDLAALVDGLVAGLADVLEDLRLLALVVLLVAPSVDGRAAAGAAWRG